MVRAVRFIGIALRGRFVDVAEHIHALHTQGKPVPKGAGKSGEYLIYTAVTRRNESIAGGVEIYIGRSNLVSHIAERSNAHHHSRMVPKRERQYEVFNINRVVKGCFAFLRE